MRLKEEASWISIIPPILKRVPREPAGIALIPAAAPAAPCRGRGYLIVKDRFPRFP